MTRLVVLTLEIPDSDEDLSSEAFSLGLRADGVDQDLVVPLLLAGVESLQRHIIRDSMEESNPLGNAEIMDTMANADARLTIVDMLMHLPFPGGQSGLSATV